MSFWLPFFCGVGAGIFSAWGIGGGTVLLLCMTLLLQVDQQTAQGINLLYFLPTAGASLLLHRKNGYLDGEAFRQAAPWGTAAALVGAFLAMYLDVSLLRKCFGVLLLYAGGSLLFSRRRDPSASSKS